MKFHIITIFPDMLTSYFHFGVVGKALQDKKIDVQYWNLRDFADNPHRSVDDRVFGGGPGMILQIEPVYKALKAIKRSKKSRVILLSASGEQFHQKMVKEYVACDELIFVCSRYEGYDARIEELVDAVVSVGPYVLSGGELAALVMVDAVARYIPGVIGHPQALEEESYSSDDDTLEYPQYTRPATFSPKKGVEWKVPEILLSGDHRKIQKWRDSKKKKK